MRAYVQTAQQQQQEYIGQIQQRYQRGWQVAHEGAKLLKQNFGAKRVVVFGSLLDASRIHLHSDIDLAVWGMDPKLYFKAVAYLQDIDPDFEVDLVEPDSAYSYMQEAIEQGVEI